MTNIALIGYGYWGPNLVRNFSEIRDCDVKYVCDKDQKQLSRITNDPKYSSIKTTDKLEDVLDDSSVDAVVVITPTATHYDITKAALSKEKHVLVEKPMTNSNK